MNTFSKVYQLVSRIPGGRVTTYGLIAEKLGIGARTVGWALHVNRDRVCTCHRAVDAKGYLRGFAQGLARKKELLEKEGVEVVDNRVDLKKYLWRG